MSRGMLKSYECRVSGTPISFEYRPIKQANSKSFIFSSVYRPPNTTVETFSKIERLIQLVDDENKEVYMLGDLNCNLLDSNLSNVKMLQEIMQLYQLTQIIDDPRRGSRPWQKWLEPRSDFSHLGFSGVHLCWILHYAFLRNIY